MEYDKILSYGTIQTDKEGKKKRENNNKANTTVVNSKTRSTDGC